MLGSYNKSHNKVERVIYTLVCNSVKKVLRKGTKSHYKHSHGTLMIRAKKVWLHCRQVESVILDFVSFVVSNLRITFF